MAFFDYSDDQLRAYHGAATLPEDFETFWRATLDDQMGQELDVRCEPVEVPLTAYEVYDLSFAGFDGARIHAWVRVPCHTTGPLPTVVNYMWYAGARGYPWTGSHFAQAGYVHITMDSRAQGWATRHFGATTDDPDPSRGATATPGVMTLGVLDRDTYYYRRLFVDTIRLLQATAQLERVDPNRVVVTGASQGGGLTLAATGLASLSGITLAGAMPDVPFLCDFPRAVGLTDREPYHEIANYLKYNPQLADTVFTTLSYFDCVNWARFCQIPVLFSTGLMDQTCPPSTVFAAYNTYAGTDKAIKVWPWNDHEGGQDHMILEQLHWLSAHLQPDQVID
ncbi:MAG: acetylxylan esterase [Propionibacteriaceae bacterium]|jgi:cephalosporin-C deacetylase|nr:acetylxylan esterase [Propionibacteriaceae bacterium]